MEINIKNLDDLILVHLNGDIEMTTMKEVKGKLLELTDNSDKNIEIDFSDVEYLDSSGIGILLTIAKKLKINGKHLKLSNLSERITKILELSSLLDIIKT